ncbi:MAG TPA: hypothetical protein DDZ78_03240, partial [Porphyromonadaceae bacterium]|nr:hypothetical protein [Porphyromonadaceae bacterium]
MKTYKLTPLEELHLEKKRVREERIISGQRLSYQIQYLGDNWGSLLTKGVTSSIRGKITNAVDNFSSGSSGSLTPFVTKQMNPWLSLVLSNLPQIGSAAWRLSKPAV